MSKKCKSERRRDWNHNRQSYGRHGSPKSQSVNTDHQKNSYTNSDPSAARAATTVVVEHDYPTIFEVISRSLDKVNEWHGKYENEPVYSRKETRRLLEERSAEVRRETLAMVVGKYKSILRNTFIGGCVCGVAIAGLAFVCYRLCQMCG